MGPVGERRLSAILAADVAGYTALMEKDSDGTVEAWRQAREEVIVPAVANHSGRIVKHTGDGFLAEFPTVQNAVRCAIEMMEDLRSNPLDFRMGINLGDIIDDGKDIHGEGVNIAARIEALAEPGGISVSSGVHEQVRNRLDYNFEDMGEFKVKNVSAPVHVIRIICDGTSGMSTRSEESQKPAPTWTVPVGALAAGLGLLAVLGTIYATIGIPGSGPKYPFDGQWEVTIHSLSGCLNNEDKSFPILVSDGKIDMKNLRIPKTGSVAADGHFEFKSMDAQGGKLNTQTGILDGNNGKGTFVGRVPKCKGEVSLVRVQ